MYLGNGNSYGAGTKTMQNVANKQMKVAIIVLNILLYLQYHNTLIVDCIYDAFMMHSHNQQV